MPRLPRMLRSIENRNYRLYFLGQMVSVLGTWLQSVAQAWLVYRLTGGSPLQLGLVVFVGQAPLLLLSPLGGLMADRYPRRWLLVRTQAASMLLAFLLAALTLGGHIRVWQILAIAAVQGMINAVDVPTRQALVSMMVKAEDLLNAVALNSTAFSNASSVAPILAGYLVATLGEGWSFAANALTYLAVIVGLLRMRLAEGPNSASQSAADRIREGFHYVHDTAPIRRILVVLTLVSLLGTPFTVLMPVFADKVLHAGPQGLGLLMSANGLGSLAGSLLLASRRGLSGLGRWIVLSSGGFGIALVLFALSRSFPAALIFLVPAGFFLFYETTASNTLVQAMSPDALRGRAIGILSMLVLGVAPFGALLAGLLAERFGAPLTVALGGVACILGSIACSFRLPVLTVQGRQLIAANLAPSGPPH
jgi:MFS family permease